MAEGWTILAADADPWADHRAAEKRACPRGFGVEDDVLEIETTDCGYVSAAQPTLVDLAAGDAIGLLTWHSALASTTPGAEAHYALTLDGATVWEITVPIPSAASVYDEQIPVERAVPAGATLVVHLHNHGANSWRLATVEAVPAGLTAE